jgi:hypothetical protein
MKTLMRLLMIAGILMLMAWSCKKDLREREFAVYPVDLYFNTTFYKNIVWEEYYNDLRGPVCQLVQIGSGKDDDEIGNFQVQLTCCWSLADCLLGRSGGYLTAGTGNAINIKCVEAISASELTSDYPSDQTTIYGKFEFTGGTGRFEGATGDGSIVCFVTNRDSTATILHHWKGSLKFEK